MKYSLENSHIYPISFPPMWASAWGEDQYGLYADLTIVANLKDVNTRERDQRFRWIAPGEFMMGSSNEEEKRYDDEDYHKVTITFGYWLADSTISQAIWTDVMGNEPAHFKGEQNPVESISWNETQSFIKKLNQLIGASLGKSVLRLPKEAEWEHACRAGTETAYSFGNIITRDQANFDGQNTITDNTNNKPALETVPDKSLPPNPWGLYGVHGNVWEWCADAWKKNLGDKAVINPYQHSGAMRVVRGGAWKYNKSRIRSACRDNYSPDYSDFLIGFRLVLDNKFKLR